MKLSGTGGNGSSGEMTTGRQHDSEEVACSIEKVHVQGNTTFSVRRCGRGSCTREAPLSCVSLENLEHVYCYNNIVRSHWKVRIE